ncbi:BREX-1 system adenine-specific DNA-methyltransferase PglX [Mesobacillus maritimus]|uniref:site-specific DNA-methyltransferase (adenine-specific) n=1 Tax=Mesobacillus maritimus TaxID=1643336 RepID=A0ABS7K9B3_9BACI|nr:BREX-1 system adenine-specific DNA-methyltransferase PglX [Mesobacillus maritimus]
MNKAELKNFAIQSRRQLIDQVKTKALMYGIDEKNGLETQEQFGQLMINDKPYPLYMEPAFNSLKNQLKQKGYKQLVEEVAYTWFNRIIAIRYMEVHDYLPEKVNVLSSSVGRVDPDILFEYETMDLPIKQEEIRELLDAGNTEGAYRKLFIAQCNALNTILPFLFEQIQDYTELLLPDFLLDAESVIKVLVQNDELTNSFEEIEVIGWLYQYYIAEEKDRVFAQKSKYKKEEIPFATQLFTPKWIVQYMVQNSLGRYWTEAHREDEDLISNWEYFIKHDEEDFHEKIAPYVNKELRVEDIKLLDPAMGSGHILVYAFEVFHQIYEKCGYPEREIPRLIIENNLYGLDIDDRAYQLAAFAVVMKAASYSRRFFRSIEREGIKLNLASIQETNHISDSVIAYIAQEEKGERYNQVKAFFNQYHNAKTYGSLINISERDFTFFVERLEHIQNNPVEDLFFAEQHEIVNEVMPALIQQTKIMRDEYDVVVMNPPYMGSRKMDKNLADFLENKYPKAKHDLFAAFMEITFYLKSRGFYASINQHSWMFLPSFESLRNKYLYTFTLDTMLHLGPNAFEEINGEVVQSTVFVHRNYNDIKFESLFYDLTVGNAYEKNIKFKSIRNTTNVFSYFQNDFLDFPGSIFAYWADHEIRNIFKVYDSIGDISKPRQGMSSSNNDLFLRQWFEVTIEKMGIGITSGEEVKNLNIKWIPYNKGGTYRKWYGNQDYVINWENDGAEVKNYAAQLYNSYTRTIKNIKFYFKEGITWSRISTSNFGLRYTPPGFIFSDAGMMLFAEEKESLLVLLGYLNSNIADYFLNILNPTIAIQSGSVSLLPSPIIDQTLIELILPLVNENISITKDDWDSKEISWEFKKHFIKKYEAKSISDAYCKYVEEWNKYIVKLESNENKIDEVFYRHFNLPETVKGYLRENKVTVEVIDLMNTSKSFISYFIGILVGRYSLDVEGLAFAGGNWDDKKYISIKPNSYGLVHFTESAYFENDIILRLRNFLAVAFSPDTVDENMQWLAEALGMKKGEDAEARLRRYFMDEFFEDHCKVYQKRPIYWLVDSGKYKGFRTLIYMHRYQPDIIATIRFEHLQEIQAKYQNEITDLENRLVNPNLSASEKKKLTAEKTSFEKKMDELREFDKRLAEIANEEIEIDLDDGVKVNYEKFYRGGKGVLAKIK